MIQFVRGDRVRITPGVRRGHVAGMEGVVDQQVQSGVIVILDNDPALKFRMTMVSSVLPPKGHVVRRFFRLGEIEKI